MSTYDEITGAIMGATTISELATIREHCIEVNPSLTDTQRALLRKSIRNRENSLLELATL